MSTFVTRYTPNMGAEVQVFNVNTEPKRTRSIPMIIGISDDSATDDIRLDFYSEDSFSFITVRLDPELRTKLIEELSK